MFLGQLLSEGILCWLFVDPAYTCKLEILQIIFINAQQYREISCKILSIIGKKKKELLERKIGRKQSKLGSSLNH